MTAKKILANSTKSHPNAWENGCNYNGVYCHFHLSIISAHFFFSLCCTCGTPIPPNPANMCVACLRTQVDISEGIPKQVTVHFCKQCERFVLPSKIMWFLTWCSRYPVVFPLKTIDRNKKFSLLQKKLECTSSFLQVFAASCHLGAVCPGVQGVACPLPEKNQELYDQSKCDFH